MNIIEKLREAEVATSKKVLVARSCARVGGKHVFGEVKGVALMGTSVACRGTQILGAEGSEGRRLRLTWRNVAFSMCDMFDLVLGTVE